MRLSLLLTVTLALTSCAKKTDHGDCYDKGDLAKCKTYCEADDPKACALVCIKTSDLMTCKKACNLKSKTSCLKLRKLKTPDQKAKEAAEAKKPLSKRQIYEESCEKGKGDACLYLATMYQKGIGALKFTGNKQYYDKFDNYVKGKQAVVKKTTGGIDMVKAATFARKACDKGSQAGCALLGTYFLEGTGVGKDAELAKALFTTACAKDDGEGCYQLGQLFANGTGVRRSAKEAARHFEKACKFDTRKACVIIAKGLAKRRDAASHKRATALFLEACRGGIGEACFIMAGNYLKGRLVKKDLKEAGSLYKMACTARYEKACTIAAEFHHKYATGFHRDTVAEMETDCAKGNGEACYTAGDLYLKGIHAKKDAAKGTKLISTACELKFKKACEALKSMPKSTTPTKRRRRRR